ncbi:MAG: hypothetical protein GC162_06490 [Planctomycetes bacterium]|nr:hypothetical protein [Planctomycetota bacterium]
MNGPQDWITTGSLIGATLAGAVACVAAVKRLRDAKTAPPDAEPHCTGAVRIERIAMLLATVLAAGVFLYRMTAVHRSWVPLQSHADGLSLLVALLGAVVIWSQWMRRLGGLALFMLPVMTLAALWAVCASWWTWRPFEIHDVWLTLHLLSVYIGALAVTAAAAAGALWLLVDRQLRAKDHAASRYRMLERLGSLEAIERTITLAATFGFILLTMGLVTGLVIVTDGNTKLGDGWWYSPKVLLAAIVWAIYALVMHVRFVPTFRGRRAAVLSIIGLILMLAVLGIAQALPSLPGALPGGG